MSLLEIGAGLGAATRVMHRRFGVWPKSFEPDPALVEAAMSLSIAAGLGKKAPVAQARLDRSEEHTSELQSLMRISYAVCCVIKKNIHNKITIKVRNNTNYTYTIYELYIHENIENNN